LIITARDICLGIQETRQMREPSVKEEKVRLCDDKLASQLVTNAHPSACVQKLPVAADEEAAVTDGVEGKQQEDDDASGSSVCSVLHDDVCRGPQPQTYVFPGTDTEAQLDFDADVRNLYQLLFAVLIVHCIVKSSVC
jgi:hypothetical protein